MQYGLIGTNVSKSYSKVMHEYISDHEFDLLSISEDKIEDFFKAKDFVGISVTMPYKRECIKYLDEIDEEALRLGSVNCIVNDNGKLKGYNTDIDGLFFEIDRAHINLKGKDVVILGSGATSFLCSYVAKTRGAKRVRICSRSDKFDLTYETLKNDRDAEIIFNATPVGSYQTDTESLIDLSTLPKLCGFVDLVYNPLNTNYIRQAKILGCKIGYGIDMLIYQAIIARMYFNDLRLTSVEDALLYLYSKKVNIVLIGMMASGKSSVGIKLAEALNMNFIDTDMLIEEKCGMKCDRIIDSMGIAYFRKVESEVINNIESVGNVIAFGGGAVECKDNIDALSNNAIFIYLDRNINKCFEDASKSSRPLARSKDEFLSLAKDRKEKYIKASDLKIKVKNIEKTVNEIIRKLK